MCKSCGRSFCTALCVVLAFNSWPIQNEACSLLQSMSIHHFSCKLCWNYIQIIFTKSKNKMKQKRTDEKSAKTVREPLTCWDTNLSLAWYAAYMQYCCSDFSLAHGGKNDIDKKTLLLVCNYTIKILQLPPPPKKKTTILFKVYSYLCLSVNRSRRKFKPVHHHDHFTDCPCGHL